jgi:glucokinase
MREKNVGTRKRGHPPGARASKYKPVLTALIDRGPLDLRALADASHVGERTIRGYVNDLGGLLSVGADGRYAVGPQAGSIFAAVVSRESLRWGLVDVHGTLLVGSVQEDVRVNPTRGRPTTPGNFVKKLARALRTTLKEVSPAPQIKACAISWHLPISSRTGDVLSFEAATPSWKEAAGVVPLVRQALSEVPDVDAEMPVVVVNDADADLFGEFKFGVARDKRVVLGVTICGGIGGGLLVDGVVHRGASGLAGEFGHTPVALEWLAGRKPPGGVRPLEEGPPCSCGADNHLECFASARAIVERLGLDTDEGSYNEFLDDLLQRVDSDPRIEYVLGDAGILIGKALRGPVLLADPDLVVISANPHHHYLLDAINSELSDLAPAVLGTSPDQKGSWIGVIGASALAARDHVIPAILNGRNTSLGE